MNAIDYATDLYQQQTTNTDFFKRRGITDATIQEWRLGYAPKKYDITNGPVPECELKAAGLLTDQGRPRFFNRTMFPIFDDQGKPISFGGRYVGTRDDVPKYLNGPETDLYHKNHVLYGMDKAPEQFKLGDKYLPGNPALLVEGYMDVLSVSQVGFKKVMGSCGTAVTKAQMEFVKKLTTETYFMYDGDIAGRRASTRGAQSAIEVGLFPHIIALENGVDPDDLAQQQGLGGILEKIERSRRSFAEHLWHSIDHRDIQKRIQALNYAVKVIARCPDPLIRLMLVDDLGYTFDFPRPKILTFIEHYYEQANARTNKV